MSIYFFSKFKKDKTLDKITCSHQTFKQDDNDLSFFANFLTNYNDFLTKSIEFMLIEETKLSKKILATQEISSTCSNLDFSNFWNYLYNNVNQSFEIEIPLYSSKTLKKN